MPNTVLKNDETGTLETFVQGDKVIVKQTQDVGPILDMTHALRNASDGYDSERTMKRMYDVPVALIDHWYHSEGLEFYNPDHADRVRMKLRSPDFQKLRSSFSNPNPNIIFKGVR